MVTASYDAESQGTTCFYKVNFLEGTRSRVKGNKGYDTSTTNTEKHGVRYVLHE